MKRHSIQTRALSLIELSPVIASGSDADPVMQPFRAAFRSWFDRLGRDADWIHLENSERFDFVESPWFASPLVPSKLRVATILRTYILSFFNKY